MMSKMDERITPFIESNLQFIRQRATELRLHHPLRPSEREVSMELGHAPGYYQQLVNGKLRPSTVGLLEICEYYELEPQEFFDSTIKNPSIHKKIAQAIEKLDESDIEHLLAIIGKMTGESND